MAAAATTVHVVTGAGSRALTIVPTGQGATPLPADGHSRKRAALRCEAMKKVKAAAPSRTDTVHENWHLGRSRGDILLTELELVMMRFHQAFERWVVHVTERSGDPTLSFSESVLLHSVRLLNQPCTTQLIARLLNRDDIANVQYSLRKLVKGGYLAHASSSAKNNAFTLTERGYRITDYYARIRHEVLVAHARNLEPMENEFQAIIDQIGILTGQYDEAMRKATTYYFPALQTPEGTTPGRK